MIREGSHFLDSFVHGNPYATTPIAILLLAGVVGADGALQETRGNALRADLEKKHREQDAIWIQRFEVLRLEQGRSLEAVTGRIFDSIRSEMADIRADNEKAIAHFSNAMQRRVELASERAQATLAGDRAELRVTLERNASDVLDAADRANNQLRRELARLVEENVHLLRTALADVSDKQTGAIQPLSTHLDRHGRDQALTLEQMREEQRRAAEDAKDGLKTLRQEEQTRLDKFERRLSDLIQMTEANHKSILRIESTLQEAAMRRIDNKSKPAGSPPAGRPWMR